MPLKPLNLTCLIGWHNRQSDKWTFRWMDWWSASVDWRLYKWTGLMVKWTDWRSDGQTDRWSNGWIDGRLVWTDGWMDRLNGMTVGCMARRMNGQMDIWTEDRMNGQMDDRRDKQIFRWRQTDGQIYRRSDEWMDGLMARRTVRQTDGRIKYTDWWTD